MEEHGREDGREDVHMDWEKGERRG
jgi:hypothetical protein